MEIYINGENKVVPDGITAAQLVEEMGLGEQRIAMEVNREIVPRSTYATHKFQSGDQIEIVHAVGGG